MGRFALERFGRWAVREVWILRWLRGVSYDVREVTLRDKKEETLDTTRREMKCYRSKS